MAKKDQPLLRAKPPKSSALNKPLIMVLAAVVVLGVLWAFLFGFNKTEELHEEQKKVNPAAIRNNSIDKLPASYMDAEGISKYLEHKGVISKKMQEELERLQKSQLSLRKQLDALHQHPSTHRERNVKNDINSQEARRSQLGFPAGRMQKKRAQIKPEEERGRKEEEGERQSEVPSYVAQNMQSQKLAFLQSSKKAESIYNPHQLVQPASPYEVQAGSIIPAVLLSGVNTSLPGTAVAQVKQNVYNTVNGKFLLIPAGSKVIGQYQSKVSYGQERILIVFNRIIMPNGDSIQLSKFTGVDAFGASGLKGDVNNHWGRILGAATISSILSVGAGIASDSYRPTDNNYIPSAQQGALTGIAGSIAGTGQQLTSRAMDIQPTLTVPPGFEFNIIVNKDIILQPYRNIDAL